MMSMAGMENGMFPEVCTTMNTSDQATARSVFYYPILKKCLENSQMGRNVADFFLNMGVTRVGFYAVNEFMDYVLRDTSVSRLTKLCLYDLHYEKYNESYYGRRVFSAEQVIHDYKESNIEKVVICNLTFADDIYRYLNDNGVRDEDIMTIDTLIYGM